jgi:hypothetical protein
MTSTLHHNRILAVQILPVYGQVTNLQGRPEENIMLRFFNTSAQTLFAASLVLAAITPPAFAGNMTGATSTYSTFSQSPAYTGQ